MGRKVFTKDDFTVYCEYPIDTKSPKIIYKIKYMGKKREKVISGVYYTENAARKAVEECVKLLNNYLEEREKKDEKKRTD